MAVLLDTTDIAPAERADALTSAVIGGGLMSRAALNDGEPVQARIGLWPLGTTAVFELDSGGLAVARTAKDVLSLPCNFVALTHQWRGCGLHTTAHGSSKVATAHTVLCDGTGPFEYSWQGRGATRTLQVPVDELGVPTDVVRRASEHLASSPLYGLVSRHVHDITKDAQALSASAVAAEVGIASIELVRALLLSTAAPTLSGREALEQTLLTQVRAYVRQHLRDPELGPDTIAAALAISTRHLYRLCGNADLHLEQWIIAKRLEAARTELSQVVAGSATIATVARRWGFKDPTHFTRRFRAAYGLPPSEWRRVMHGRGV